MKREDVEIGRIDAMGSRKEAVHVRIDVAADDGWAATDLATGGRVDVASSAEPLGEAAVLNEAESGRSSKSRSSRPRRPATPQADDHASASAAHHESRPDAAPSSSNRRNSTRKTAIVAAADVQIGRLYAACWGRQTIEVRIDAATAAGWEATQPATGVRLHLTTQQLLQALGEPQPTPSAADPVLPLFGLDCRATATTSQQTSTRSPKKKVEHAAEAAQEDAETPSPPPSTQAPAALAGGAVRETSSSPSNEAPSPTAPSEIATAKLTCLDAAARILAESRQAMTCPDLIAAMAAHGYWTSPGGRTPAATLSSAILREIQRQGQAARFVKTGRGTFMRRTDV